MAVAQAEAPPQPVDSESAAADVAVQVGFSGAWKLGHICPVRVEVQGALLSAARIVRVRSIDGDGVDVAYDRVLGESEWQSSSAEIWLPVRVGQAGLELLVELLDADGQVLASVPAESQDLQSLDSDQPLVLALNSSLGLEQLLRSNASGTDSNFSTVVISDPEQLPPDWRDYSSVDVLLIAAQDVEFLDAIGDKWQALDLWIRNGGGCVISVSPQIAEQLMAQQEAFRERNQPIADSDTENATTPSPEVGLSAFLKLLPGNVLGQGVISDPGALESLVGTQDPLERFSAVRFEAERGRVELAFSDTLSRSTPWWITFAHGHGTVRVVLSDLDAPAFNNWDDRRLFWEKLIEPYLDRKLLEGSVAESQTADTSYLGYDDLVGQLRATLDVFQGVRVISFGQISAALIAIVLLIGPVDYLISVRWLKRPQVSWWFTGAVLLLACSALAWLGSWVHEDRVLVNTVQILDIDGAAGTSTGTLWSHVYCGNARKLNVQARGGDGAAVTLDWQGLPGQGLGGLNTQLSTDRGMPPYRIELAADRSSSIFGVGIPTGGSKGFSANWSGAIDLETDFDLSELPGVDQLTGEFKNPFAADVKDSVIFYHNWFYRLNSRIPAGDRVTISSDTIPKDIARKLNERREIDDKVSTRKWDPSDRDSVDRLLELMMFHKAATGSNYTSLAHRYQPMMDHSNLLETDYAILVGRLDEPLVALEVNNEDDTSVDAQQLMDRVWFRLLIPVRKPEQRF
ncbi:MAG: hypothetical protein NXI32_04445 [bacterium]|nr:hypothetical protein [bacterium]